MTIYELEDALVEFTASITVDFRFRSNEQQAPDTLIPPQVYSGFIPRNEVGEIIPGDISVYPAIILNAVKGEQTWESELTTVNFIIGCFDDTRDQQGYRDVANVIQRLKDGFRFSDIIRDSFPIRMPLKWANNKRYSAQGGTNSYPYFFGEMDLIFEMEIAASQFDATFYTGDVNEGQFRRPHLSPTPYDEREST